jgi:DNA invertase Pin-like site-specific DNA recombinase
VAPARAAIYARVSSDQQAERHTIASQVQDLLARAAADGHEVGDAFRFLDDGHSGASLVRPALERLRDLVGMASVDVLYVHAPDRLARSYAHQAVLVEEFARAGTEVGSSTGRSANRRRTTCCCSSRACSPSTSGRASSSAAAAASATWRGPAWSEC